MFEQSGNENDTKTENSKGLFTDATPSLSLLKFNIVSMVSVKVRVATATM